MTWADQNHRLLSERSGPASCSRSLAVRCRTFVGEPFFLHSLDPKRIPISVKADAQNHAKKGPAHGRLLRHTRFVPEIGSPDNWGAYIRIAWTISSRQEVFAQTKRKGRRVSPAPRGWLCSGSAPQLCLELFQFRPDLLCTEQPRRVPSQDPRSRSRANLVCPMCRPSPHRWRTDPPFGLVS